MCGQEGSGEYHSYCSSYHSAFETLLQEDDAPLQLENTLLQHQLLQRHDMFYEECNQPVSNSVRGGFEENLIPHVYDEMEGE